MANIINTKQTKREIEIVDEYLQDFDWNQQYKMSWNQVFKTTNDCV